MEKVYDVVNDHLIIMEKTPKTKTTEQEYFNMGNSREILERICHYASCLMVVNIIDLETDEEKDELKNGYTDFKKGKIIGNEENTTIFYIARYYIDKTLALIISTKYRAKHKITGIYNKYVVNIENIIKTTCIYKDGICMECIYYFRGIENNPNIIIKYDESGKFREEREWYISGNLKQSQKIDKESLKIIRYWENGNIKEIYYLATFTFIGEQLSYNVFGQLIYYKFFDNDGELSETKDLE